MSIIDELSSLLGDLDTRGAIRTVHVRPEFLWRPAARSYCGKRARRQAFYRRQRDDRVMSRALRSAPHDQHAITKAILDAQVTGIGWVTMSPPPVDFPKSRGEVPG